MYNEEILTEKQIQSAEKLARLIDSIPQDKKAAVIAVMNAYTDGFITRNMMEIDTSQVITAHQLSFDDILGKDGCVDEKNLTMSGSK